MAAVRACPMCKDPVTLGGGSVMTNIPSGFIFPSFVNRGLKNPSLSHQAYHDDSTAAGLYFSNAPSSRLCSTMQVSPCTGSGFNLSCGRELSCRGTSCPWLRHLSSSWPSLTLSLEQQPQQLSIS